MVSTRKIKNQQKKKLGQLDENLSDFFIGNSAKVNVSENENLEQQTNGHPHDFDRFDHDNARQNQVIENNIDKLKQRSVVLSRLSKIACMTRFWKPNIKW